MRRIPSWGLVLGVILVAAVLGGGIGWWVSRTDTTTEPAKVVTTTSENPQQSSIPAAAPAASVSSAPGKAAVASKPAPPKVADGTTSLPADGWQEKLDEVLSTDGEPDQKAERLLQMFPHLSEEAQVEVGQHLVNFITDDAYAPIAQILTNTATTEAVSAVFMTDLLNRTDGLKLPLLLAMAREEANPKHAEAKELLELFLQENHGTDWAKWESSVTNWIAQNGSEVTAQSPPEPATETNP